MEKRNFNTKREVTHVTLDDRDISPEEWDDYDRRMEVWKEKYKGRMNTMDAAMSKPNPPNYFRANND